MRIPTQSPAEEKDPLKLLNGMYGFGGALWDLSSSCFGAHERISSAARSKKKDVFDAEIFQWRESMVAEIRRWAPEYVNVAVSRGESDPLAWSRDQICDVIAKRLRKADEGGSVAYWLRGALFGSRLAEERTDNWTVPDWMGYPKGSGDRARAPLIRSEHSATKIRLNYALDETLARLRISMASSEPQTRANKPRARLRSPLKRSVLSYLTATPEASDKDILTWLEQTAPKLVPKSWQLNPALSGKLFTKVRRLLKH